MFAHFLHINAGLKKQKAMITTRLYLDTRRSADGRPAPLKISIYHNRKVAYLSTGIKVLPSAWDAAALMAKDKSTMLSISRFKLKIDTMLLDLLENGKLDGLSASGIRDLVQRELNPADAAAAKFMECLKAFAKSRRMPRTQEIYMATYDRILAFDPKAESLEFQDITVGWLDRFDSFLAITSPKRNARNVHLRNIKAVFNDALKKELTLFYPFRKFDVKPEPTMHKNLLIGQLRSLFNAKVKPWQQKYVDFFKISFMLIGINTGDLIHASGINGDRLEYDRAKTHKPYSIKVEPECLELINKYRGRKYLLNVLDTYSKTNHWTSKVNNELQAIAADLGLPKISTNWMRHTWATIAAELDIPKDTIARAAGHSSKTVTDIYINFDMTKIDRANRQILDYVLYDKKPQDMFDLIRQLNENVSKMTQNAM